MMAQRCASQAVIFAGGLGTRMAELTEQVPKPAVIVGKKPIIFHIIDFYFKQGVNNFVILGGYKFDYLKELFSEQKSSIIERDEGRKVTFSKLNQSLPKGIEIELIFTGLHSETGTRLKMALDQLEDRFYFTYGDGLSDVSLDSLDKNFKNQIDIVVSTVNPRSRYGEFYFNEIGSLSKFEEKPVLRSSWVNAGFGLMTKKLINEFIEEKNVAFEPTIIKNCTEDGRLGVLKHLGYFRSIDSVRDVNDANADFEKWNGNIPWLKNS